MAVYKEIAKADGSGVTTFYRLSDVLDTAETDDQEGQAVIIDYNQAQNKPSINNVALVGNKTSEDLGLQPAGDYITNDEADAKFIDEDELEAKNYVNQAELQDAIAHIEHFHREIVAALPVTGDPNVLYLVRKQGSGEDIYNEYIWVGKTASETGYEFIGTTATDLTDYYQKEEVDDLLDGKVDKVNGKGLSEQNYTLAEKTKLAGLENYDDTEIQAKVSGLNTDVNNLKSSNVTISNTLAELKPNVESNTAAVSTIYDLLDNKMTAIRLVEQGDGWVWMNLEGSRLTYAQASAALGHENCMLFIEQLENDGKVIPAEYKSEGDHINVIFKDLDSLVHIMTCGEDDVVVTEDVTTTNRQADFTIEDEAVGYTTKMTALYGNTTQNGTPTPDAPVPVEVVTGENTINICGKNLFNKNNVRAGYRFGSDGEYYASTGYNATEYIRVQPSTLYSVSWPMVWDEVVCTYDINKTFIRRLQSGTNFTTSASEYYIRANVSNAHLDTAQIEKGTATTYEPYQSQTYPINLGSMELCKIGTYQDYLYKDNGKWYKHKEIGKYNFTGNETISLQNRGKRIFISAIKNPIPEPLRTTSENQKFGMYSNKLVEDTAGNTWSGIQGVSYDYDAGKNTGNFDISINGISTLEEYRTAIVGIELVYILQTPTNTEITDTTLLAQLNALEQITQYKHTYITITGANLIPEADFTYIRNIVINNNDTVLGKDTYWNNEVPTSADLPSNAQEGEIRIVQDTENVYIYNGTKWVPFDKSGEIDLSNYLAKDNTTPWIPTGAFNPATKKYVDDSVGGVFVPTKTSQLTNDSNFIGKNSNDLTHYYTKSQTYNKSEVDALIGSGNISITVSGDTLVITTE